MARQSSAASIKGSRQGRGLHHDAPREGTLLRRVYDLLLTGEEICLMDINYNHKHNGAIKNQLVDFYGLEIITVRKGKRNHKGTIKCIGVWDGPYLIPLERLHPDESGRENES